MQRLALLGLVTVLSATSASALVISGSGTSVPGGGSCSVSGIPSTGSGAILTCTGVNIGAPNSSVYIGINNATNVNGLTMTGVAPTGGTAAVYRSSSTGASSITYTSTTTVTSAIGSPAYGTDTVSNTLTLTRTAGTGTVTATGGTPADGTLGDIGHLFRITTGGTFTLVVDADSTHPDIGGGQSCNRYDTIHSTAGAGNCRSGVDIKFYWSTCGDGVLDSVGESCDDGGANGTAGSCCTTSCTFKTNGTGCTDDGNECTNDTCNGASSVCQHPNKTAGTLCTDSSPTNCLEAQCNGSGVCNQSQGNEAGGTPCAGNGTGECTAADTCNGSGTCLNNDTAAGTSCIDTSAPMTTGNCKDAQCNGTGTCDQNFANETDGSGCADGDFCNGSETCTGGVCGGSSGDPCDGPGDPDTDCSETCVDTGYEVGNCNGTDVNGSACSDGQYCTGTESCTGGVCGSSTGDPCPGPDGDADCQESCNEIGDNCLANDANGSACTGNGTGDCTAADTCQAGVCDDNDLAAGTQCTDSSPPSTGNCEDAQCDGNNSCVQNFANETDGTGCDNGFFCDGTETCTAGTCGGSSGDPCPGPDGDVNCSESCDEGANNCLAPDTDGTLCRADAGECDVQETCLAGSCPGDAFEPAATACGDPSDTDCSNPDSCDGSGTCDPNNEIIGFACGDPSDTDCTDPDTCDGAGACEDNHELPTVVCRPATTGGDCDEVENCDGAGNCPADGFTTSGVTCRPPTGDCDLEEECTGTSPFCPTDGFEPALTPCGDPTNTDCDNPDTCAGGSDTCLDNLEANGFACGDPSNTDCTDPDTCDGAGTCEANHAAAATACGDPSNTDCTDPDTCDGAGTCEDNHAAAATACGDPSDTDCTNPDTCDGGGACLVNNEADGTTCGDPSDTTCSNPDSCLSGACNANHEPNTVLCLAATSGGECDEDEYCDGAGNCPPSLPLASGTECRAATSGALCDEPEECDGVSFFCPADAPKTNGTVCRPDAGDCDVQETCDGVSYQCPADGFELAGTSCGSPTNTDCDNPDTCNGSGTCLVNNEPNSTPCDDSSACTGGDVCTGGVCTGPIDLCPDLDHYKCYQGKDLKNPKFTKIIGVNTTDQLATNELVDVKKLKFVCSPVDKNGEGINAPGAHLACYQLKAPKFAARPKVEVSTQFQTSKFEIKKGKLLCLPATKSILPP